MSTRHGLVLAAVLLCGSCGRHSSPAALPEQRPADLVVTVHEGGGEDGSWWSVTIDGKGGTRRASGGTPDTTFPVSADGLDEIWQKVRAAHVERIRTHEVEHGPDEIGRAVTIEFGGKRYSFGASDALDDPKAQPDISAIDGAIMALSATGLPRH